MSVQCEACGTQNKRGEQFCAQCGRLLPEERQKQDGSANPFAGIFGGDDPARKTGTGAQAGANAREEHSKMPGFDADARASAGRFGDIFGNLFGGTQASGIGARTEPEERQASGARAPSPGTLGKVEALKRIAAAASRAMVRSLALSAAVLGPGFLLLLAGYMVPGMIWLFAVSSPLPPMRS